VGLVEETVGGLLGGAARESPNSIALVDGSASAESRRRWTYGELDNVARAMACRLRESFEPGERVTLWAPNVPEWVIFQFGAALAGLVLVTANPKFVAPEIEYVLRHSRSAGLVFLKGKTEPDASTLTKAGADLPDLRLFLDLQTLCLESADIRTSSQAPHVGPGDPAMILYTSGTTGTPKGALLSHHALTNNSRLMVRRLGVGMEGVWLNPMPMHHISGSQQGAMGAVWTRSAHVITSFEAGRALKLITEERPGVLVAVTTMLLAMSESPGFATADVSSLATLLLGGASFSVDFLRGVEAEFGVRISVLYGQTETTGPVCQSDANDTLEDRSRHAGHPLEHTEVMIADPDHGQPVGCNQVGEIRVRGYSVTLGYFDAPQLTREAITSDGWLKTGDLGAMDGCGNVQITGRLKDLIRRGGENIHPREIEDRLVQHSGVAEAAVAGVPDETFGEELVAFIRVLPGVTVTKSELVEHLRRHVAPFKIPKIWLMVSRMPLTPSGRIQKYVLVHGFVQGDFARLE
jgi:fatty-acyl-CoA synthase